jgi:very-short-patch-repair endonuclease
LKNINLIFSSSLQRGRLRGGAKMNKDKNKRRELRNNMTKAEYMVWRHLRKNQLGYKFRRQHGFGKYIVDFYCKELKLVIEIDGDVHCDEVQKAKDAVRTKYLESLGLRVKRYNNLDVLYNIYRLMDDLVEYIKNTKS